MQLPRPAVNARSAAPAHRPGDHRHAGADDQRILDQAAPGLAHRPHGALAPGERGVGQRHGGRDGQAGAREGWTWGLRNPWRFSWDRVTKDLWIADVGQNSFEEIDFLAFENGGAGRGANMGWPLAEGTHPYEGATPAEGAVPPIFDYDRANGECSVTGGYVYRGSRLPSLTGVYLYADYCKDDVRGLLRKPDGSLEEASLGLTVPGGAITTFGQDADGELFVASQTGGIYRFVPA